MPIKKTKPFRVDAFDFSPGRKIAGKYQIVSLLGSGWEGEVYKVSEIDTGIERAAKLFFPQRNRKDKTCHAYALKLHRLSHCSILIQYHTKEVITFRKHPVTVLISEYVDGIPLHHFLKKLPARRLDPFQALHLLYALTCGIEEIHLLNEYHGDLHTENILVHKYGLGFSLKLLDFFNSSTGTRENMKYDICGLIQIFHECMGGARTYSKLPPVVKDICSGLKHSLILKKFRTVSHLREHLETMEWMST